MNTEVSVTKKFRVEALNILLLELETMWAQNRGYTTVVFQIGRRDISILYSEGVSCIGQSQQYPRKHWSLLDLALPLFSAMGYYRTGKKLCFYDESFNHLKRWTLDTGPLGEEALPFVHETLQKIDDAFRLFFHTVPVASQSSLLPSCKLCGASLVRDDDGEPYRCSSCGI